MKAIQLIICASLAIILSSCEEQDDNSLTTAERLEGQWTVDEEDHLKSIKQFYRVYIDPYPGNSSKVIITNFYGLDTDDVEANISGMTLIVPEQETGDFLVRGSASISSNYKKLTWQYYVDDGSGIEVEVHAIYTKGDY